MHPRLPILLALAAAAAAPAAAQTPRDVTAAHALVAEATAAYRKQDLRETRRLLVRAAALRPDHPTILYNLAGTQAALGDTAAAFENLRRLARMGIALPDPAADPDFAALRGPALVAVSRALAENARPVVSSAVGFALADPAFMADGIAHDAVSGRFFVGSVHQRRIAQVGRDGAASDFRGPGEDGLWSVLGLAADPARRRLWVATSAMPETAGVDSAELGAAALLEYDLDRDALVRRYPYRGDGKRMLGDLTVAADGAVYLSDPRAGAVLRLRPGAETLEELLPAGALVSPQGLALSADGATLYIADYSMGLLALRLSDRQMDRLPSPPGTTLLGIDGLARAGDHLVAVQNGIRPHRVVRLRLDEGGRAVAGVDLLETAHPRHDEPTGGVMVGDDLWYVANGQFHRFRDGVPQPPLAAPVVLRLPIPNPLRSDTP